MLPHYSALKVAEQFRVLEAIAPGRIDLGVGRAPGSDRLTAMALNPHSNAHEEFPRQVYELQAWITGAALPAEHPFRRVAAHPRGPTSPELWILGSSDYGARLAAHFGLPYAFAYFFSDGRGVEQALSLYRRNYQPSARYPESIATICVWALAADTETEARRLMGSRELWRIGFEKGERAPLASPEEAAAYPYTDTERAVIRDMRDKALVGTPTSGGHAARAGGRLQWMKSCQHRPRSPRAAKGTAGAALRWKRHSGEARRRTRPNRPLHPAQRPTSRSTPRSGSRLASNRRPYARPIQRPPRRRACRVDLACHGRHGRGARTAAATGRSRCGQDREVTVEHPEQPRVHASPGTESAACRGQ
jgi:hypothetical protein